jgi:hypothetical protein
LYDKNIGNGAISGWVCPEVVAWQMVSASRQNQKKLLQMNAELSILVMDRLVPA